MITRRLRGRSRRPARSETDAPRHAMASRPKRRGAVCLPGQPGAGAADPPPDSRCAGRAILGRLRPRGGVIPAKYYYIFMSTCQILDCGRKMAARGWCDVHYGRWRRTGDPNKIGGNRAVLTRESLDQFSDVDEQTGCRIWNRSRGGAGYGRYRGKAAHRVVWALFHGPIPDGMLVCHRCDNPPCVEPDHLFLGSHGDNVEDSIRKGRMPQLQRPRAKRCSVADCSVPAAAKGFCGKHYQRWRAHGDPLKVGKRGPEKGSWTAHGTPTTRTRQ